MADEVQILQLSDPTKVTKKDVENFGTDNLVNVVIPDGVTAIGTKVFADCKNLKQINIPDSVTNMGYDVFSDNLEKFVYKGHVIKSEQMHFAETLSDGLDTLKCLDILARSHEILNDDIFSPILVTKLCQAEHNGRLEQTAAKIAKDFQIIGFYDISDKVDVNAKQQLIKLFQENEKSRGVVPKIIDALTIASTTLHIKPETIVHVFEDKKFRDAIIAMRSCHEGNYFFDVEAVLFAMTFDVNQVKNVILDNPYKDYASVLLCDGYKNNNENSINASKWIAAHPDTNKETIDNIFKYKDYLDITPDMTVDTMKAQFSKCEAQLETKRIEREYEGFEFEDCVCNLQKTEVELGKYKAYVMDGQDPRQVMLGYDTNCCQHLGGAGETAMIYGLVNPNAGFWVIEDKESGKILAQAECWETDNITLTNAISDDMLVQMLNVAIQNKYINIDDITECFSSVVRENGDAIYFDGENSGDWGIKVRDGLVADINTSPDYDTMYYMGHDENFRNGFNKYCKDYGLKTEMSNYGDLITTKGGNYQSILVFDNIEFADDRQIDQFAPIIAKWCEASPYQNMLMGNGYNEMVNSEIRQADGVEPPLTADILGTLDVDGIVSCREELFGELFPSPTDVYDAIATNHPALYDIADRDVVDNIIEDIKPYTDAGESCSLLKVDGQVEPYFVKAYEPFKEAEKQCKAPQQRPEPQKEKSAYIKRLLAQAERQSHGRNISRDDFDR